MTYDPETVTTLRRQIADADARLFCPPEYAGTLPGSLKNLLDWAVGGGEIYPASLNDPQTRLGQLHLELLALTKLWTELTRLAAALVTVEIWAAEGLDVSPATELLSVFSDDVMALVWLGKSPLAELTSLVALLCTAASCDFRPLTPLLVFRLVSPLTEFSRLVRSAQ